MTTTAGHLRRWGPVVEKHAHLWSDRAIELTAEYLDRPLDSIADTVLRTNARNRYILLRRIATTRRSCVWAAVDLLICRLVAIKMHPEIDDDVTSRVLVEARAMSRVEPHANIVQVLDVGDHAEGLYTVLELCETDLASWSIDKPWPDIVDRILEAGAGLEAVHAASLVHADVKPANILVSSGIAKLADFGLCGPPGPVIRISGTPGYIAPEATDGLRLETCDVFGLACSAWFCLLGVDPFGPPPLRASASSAVLTLVERARAGEIALPTTIPKGLPTRVLDVLRAGLDADPRRRPPLPAWLASLEQARVRSLRGGWWRSLGRGLP